MLARFVLGALRDCPIPGCLRDQRGYEHPWHIQNGKTRWPL